DRYVEPDSHQTDARPKSLQDPVTCAETFRKNNRAVPSIDELSRVSQSSPNSRHLLWKRISIVKRASEKIRNGCCKNLFKRVTARFEIGTKMVLHHGGRQALMPSMRQCGVESRYIKMARVIGCEDHGRFECSKMFQSCYR